MKSPIQTGGMEDLYSAGISVDLVRRTPSVLMVEEQGG